MKNNQQIRGYTELGAVSNVTTGDARVDFFEKTIRDISQEFLIDLLQKSWDEDKLDTLKLIFYIRDCRGGKGEKKIFERCCKWLTENQQEHMKINMQHISEFGYYKDYFNIFFGTDLEQEMLDIISEQLIKDVKDKNDNKTVSLCAKFAPTEKCHHDKKYQAVNKIVKTLKQKNEKYTVTKYRKTILTPLRQYLDLVEVLMCSNQWQHINFSKTPSLAMNRYNKAFKKHTPEKYTEWIENVKKGEAKVNATMLYPHEIASYYIDNKHRGEDALKEEQWKVLVKEVEKYGTLQKCIIACDVSGSMSGMPMCVSKSLGVLISQLVSEPFKDLVIAFKEEPVFHVLEGDTLYKRIQCFNELDLNIDGTNFQKIFQKILKRAIEYKTPQEKMPVQVIVISDMQFDFCDEGQCNFEAVEKQYLEAGYVMPKMVFWNVRSNTTDFMTKSDQKNVALVSGFSTSILESIIQCKEMTPYSVMRSVIDKKRYDVIQLATN